MDSIINAKKKGLQKLSPDLAKQNIKLVMGDLTIKKNNSSIRLYMKSRMYILNSKNLQLFLLQ